VASAIDTNGVSLTGLNLEYGVKPRPPQFQPAGWNGDPALAGAPPSPRCAKPPNCNMSSYNQIGLFGNGKPVTSNRSYHRSRHHSTVLYMASTQSQYMRRSTSRPPCWGSPTVALCAQLMVISNDGSTSTWAARRR